MNPFKRLTKFEMCLWLTSVAVIIMSAFFSGAEGVFSAIASLIGVTALIFLAKGMVIGQVLVIVFAVFYGIISIIFKYYGEAITYLGMSAPMAGVSIVAWIKHPYKDSGEVKVAKRLKKRQILTAVCGAAAVTVAFYFILKALGNASLIFSTISIATSFIACYLTYCRSPFYALGYALNDIVLIVLWIIAAIKDVSCLSMIFCFVMFLANDLYGFYSWKRMQKRQAEE